MRPKGDPIMPSAPPPAPCDSCALYDLCADSRLACVAYSQYVNDDPENGGRNPTHPVYLEIFSEAGDAEHLEAERCAKAQRARERNEREKAKRVAARERARAHAIQNRRPAMFSRTKAATAGANP